MAEREDLESNLLHPKPLIYNDCCRAGAADPPHVAAKAGSRMGGTTAKRMIAVPVLNHLNGLGRAMTER